MKIFKLIMFGTLSALALTLAAACNDSDNRKGSDGNAAPTDAERRVSNEREDSVYNKMTGDNTMGQTDSTNTERGTTHSTGVDTNSSGHVNESRRK